MKRSSAINIDDIAPVAKKSPTPVGDEVTDAKTVSDTVVIKGDTIGLGFCNDAKVYEATGEMITYTYKGHHQADLVEAGYRMALNYDLSLIHPYLKKGALVDCIIVSLVSPTISFEWADEEGECIVADCKLLEYVVAPITSYAEADKS